jgi:hypothetical protein
MALSPVSNYKKHFLTEIRVIGLGRSCLSKLSIEDFFASMFSIASFFGRNFYSISPKNKLFI